MFSKHKSASVPADHTEPPPALPQSATSADEPLGRVGRSATIGAHTRIEGNVIGEEELIIDGQVVGTVAFKRNTVSIGSAGRVEGDIYAQTLHVAGSVEGRLIASHKITVHHTAHIVGTIITPCLVLEDGAVFRGNIDMDAENDVLLSAFEGSDQKTAPHTKTQGSEPADSNDADAAQRADGGVHFEESP
ncbi:polymer-forming cytoskeletal protein [Halomonas sp. M5N1S17]|uniref:bactofilin family protein n=1 Tax=Halomonas alkalisoli TaxID=2907158 RepID=UPI001F350BA8|nr:polymer-forming cytoskeletal protein [Halomonas alkalisoli]MCE9662700.1 polymer-forming cytoskeletal protein [Halomonas alkalisoli]